MAQRGRPKKNRTEEQNKEMIDNEIKDLDRNESDFKPSVHEEVESLIEKRRTLAMKITDMIASCSDSLKDILQLEQEIYVSLFKPDSLFSDCPISPSFTKDWARQQFYAAGIKWGEDIWEGELSVKPFIERIKEAEPWVMRYAKEPIKEKTGIEAIVEKTN